MIALTPRKAPRWPAPADNDGRWVYIELLLDGGRQRIGGYVNLLHSGTAARDWLTHELCAELEALHRLERRARTPKGYAVRMIFALKRAVQLAGGLVPRDVSRPLGREHYRACGPANA
jgi:hypothetical protein